MFRLRFAVFFEVNNNEKAERLADKIKQLFDAPVIVEQLEKYWKIENQWKVIFVVELSVENQAQAVLTTLNLCDKFSSGWLILPPKSFANGAFEFNGTSNSDFRFSAISFVEFLLMHSKNI